MSVSSATLPGFEAVPALMTPGYIWPGVPYELAGPGPVLAAGTLYTGWAAGTPYTGWQAGTPVT